MILAQDWKKEEANIQPSYIQSMIIVSLETVPHFSKSLQYMVTLKEKWTKLMVPPTAKWTSSNTQSLSLCKCITLLV